MSWRHYANGPVTARVVIVCDGRRPGDHPRRTVATWWRDRTGWQCYAGRPLGRRYGQPDSGRYENFSKGITVARLRCPVCGVDVRLREQRWLPALDRASGVGRLRLADIARAAC